MFGRFDDLWLIALMTCYCDRFDELLWLIALVTCYCNHFDDFVVGRFDDLWLIAFMTCGSP